MIIFDGYPDYIHTYFSAYYCYTIGGIFNDKIQCIQTEYSWWWRTGNQSQLKSLIWFKSNAVDVNGDSGKTISALPDSNRVVGNAIIKCSPPSCKTTA